MRTTFLSWSRSVPWSVTTFKEKYNIGITWKSIKVIDCHHEDIRRMRLPSLFYFLRENVRFYVTQYHDQSQLSRKNIISALLGNLSKWLTVIMRTYAECVCFIFYVKNDRFYVTQYHDQSQLIRKNIISTFLGNLSKWLTIIMKTYNECDCLSFFKFYVKMIDFTWLSTMISHNFQGKI